MSSIYIIASPIGNLEDISLRALRVLKELKTLYCEDTRVTMKLINHFQLGEKKLISCNKENEEKRCNEILARLSAGEDIGIISDAGTPLISDPGSSLIQAISGTEHTLVPLPGASALTAALSVCPIDCSRFVFEGFLPHGPKQRRRVLKTLSSEARPLVFFESPHRILKTLEDIKNVFVPSPTRKIFLARELTKKFEQHYFGAVEEIIDQLKTQFPKEIQGEFVLVVGGLELA
jgi:16S rRNA (cytidine1402-2'-O)-methyltransferase